MTTTEYVDPEQAMKTLDGEVHSENIEAIQTFVDHLAAEGLSDTHQDRMIRAFKMLLTNFAPDDFRLDEATEADLKQLVAKLNRSDYAASTKEKMRAGLKKYYKIKNGC
jgi:site-specific recombinase XerD